jgi:RNA polymerase sigma-70 factor (ECF subfamily)
MTGLPAVRPSRYVGSVNDTVEPMPTNVTPGPLEGMLRDVGQKDRKAFRHLYDATASRLFAVIVRLVGHRDVAEDVLQDVYVQVWQRAAAFDAAEGAAMPWLIAIARYRSIDRLRTLGRLVPVGDAVNEAETAIAPAGQSAESTAIRLAVSSLPENHRRALELTYRLGLTNEELAAALSVPLGTAKSWVKRGLDALKVRLDV